MDKSAAISTIELLLKNPEQTFILSTLTEDGYPDARLMGNICEKSLDTVYFTCRGGTRKIDEIEKNPKACVYFTCNTVTVWLYGDAKVTRDEEIRQNIWNDRMQNLYSEGVDSPSLAIIEFVPRKIRIRKNPEDYVEFDL